MGKFILVTDDEEIMKLSRLLFMQDSLAYCPFLYENPAPHTLLDSEKDKELLIIDATKLKNESVWIPFIESRKEIRILVQFTSSGPTNVKDIIDILLDRGIRNQIEFIILDNYSVELKLLLLREQLLQLMC